MHQFSEMSSLWVVSGALCVFFSVIYADDFGPGIWDPISIQKCEEPDHKFKYDLQLENCNATHGMVKGHIVSEETFTKDFGIRLVLYKYDGDECKQMQMFQEDCLFNFVMTYAEDDVKGLLTSCGVDPPDVPIEKGEYDVNDYVFAKRQGMGVYGSFLLKSIILEGDKEVGCMELKVEFHTFED